MQYRQLGRSGVRVSVLGIGTNRFGSKLLLEGVKEVIAAAQDLGINFIDTADIYTGGRSEETLGEALKGRWDRFIVATKYSLKAGEGTNDRGSSRYHLLNALHTSLRRLQSDHIDLLYVHEWDPTTPIDETMRALDDVVRMGKVRYLGASNYAAWQIASSNLLAELRGWSPFVVVQMEYHLLSRSVEREILPYCRASGVGFIPYYPLAGGFLTGKYRRGEPPPPGSRGADQNAYLLKWMTDVNFDRLERLERWAQERGHTLTDLAHAWLLAQPEVCAVISGVTRLEQLKTNVKAVEWALTPDEVQAVNALLADDQP